MGLIVKTKGTEGRPEGGVPPSERIATWLRLMTANHPRGGTLELRAMGVSRVGAKSQHSEVFHYPLESDSFSKMGKDAAKIGCRSELCTFNLNPLRPGLEQTAHDSDVISRVWLPIDCDTIRTGEGKGQSATDNEKQLTWQTAIAIRNHLTKLGWPLPITADSGNGYHLLYRIDLPTDDEGLVARCLRVLDARFTWECVKVDPVIFNASRPWKLYGTFARKGIATEERPYRQAQVLVDLFPAGPDLVDLKLIEALAAAEAPRPGTSKTPIAGGKPSTNDNGSRAAHLNGNGKSHRKPQLIVRAIDPDDPIERAKAYLDECDSAISGQAGHSTTFRVVCAVGPGFDLDPDDCFRLIKEHYSPRCDPPWSDKEIEHKVEQAYTKEKRRGWLKQEGHEPEAKRGPGRPRTRPEPVQVTDPATGQIELFDDPHRLARLFLAEQYPHHEGWLLRYWDEQWHAWDGEAWRVRKNREIDSEITAQIKAEFDRIAETTGAPAKGVGTRLMGNVANALRGEVLMKLGEYPSQPAWIDPAQGDENPQDYLPTANGLVHLPTLVIGSGDPLRPPTPRFFGPSCLAYPFDPNAPTPALWHQFLQDLWPDDPDARACLQEWFGYLLTLDTSRHKILLLVGPRRSGKGTISRILEQLVGTSNYAAPTLASLAHQFGLAPLIGKQLAMVPEARLSGRADSQTIVERLLSISGEDPQSIDRKHLTAWVGKLHCRFVLMGNELPRLGDQSGAIASRLIVLQLKNSFLGKEDLDLTSKLHGELPGILLWAIEGLQRLRRNGKFTLPASSEEIAEEFERMASPIGAFIADLCDVGPNKKVLIADLYEAFVKWSEDNGRDMKFDKFGFGRALRAALPDITARQHRGGSSIARYYYGICLRWQAENGGSTPF